MGIHKHKLTNKNTTEKTAKCSHCGDVSIRFKSGTFRCVNGIKEQSAGGGHGRSKKGHGLTLEEARKYRQDKACEICGTNFNLAVDHCHTTKRIRGVLCKPCNSGLGMFKDNEELLNKAIRYLKKI